MATFETAARATGAVQTLQRDGYRTYSANVTLRDGRPAVSVYVGPCTTLADAKRDFDRARQIPGYETASILPVAPPEFTSAPNLPGSPPIH
jgi:hypothetical protein